MWFANPAHCFRAQDLASACSWFRCETEWGHSFPHLVSCKTSPLDFVPLLYSNIWDKMFTFLFVIPVKQRQTGLTQYARKGRGAVISLKTILGQSPCLICVMHCLTMLENTMLAYEAHLWKLQACMEWNLFSIMKCSAVLNFCWLFSSRGMSEPRDFLMLPYIRIWLIFWWSGSPKAVKPLKIPPAFCSTLHVQVSFW